MNTIKRITYRAIERPLRTLFSTSLGKKTVMRSVIIKITLDDGRSVLGEVPTSFVLKHETVPNILAILKTIAPRFLGRPAEDSFSAEISQMRKKYPDNPMTASGFEIALFRAALASKNISEHKYWGAKTRRIETDITIPFITDADDLDKWMRYVMRLGFRIYKVKVSGDIEADLKLLSLVRDYLANRFDYFTIRVDGNQGYTRQSYLKMADLVQKHRFDLELFEQPLPKHDYDGLKFVKKRSPIPIILDETVFCGEDAERVVDRDLGHGINIKFAKSGIAESEKIFKIARRSKLTLMVGCMTETMVGLSAGIYCAAGTDAFDYIDLDGVFFLHQRSATHPIQIKAPEFVL